MPKRHAQRTSHACALERADPLGACLLGIRDPLGTTLNIAATAGALAGFALGLPDVLAFAVHLLPLPYVFVAVVRVYRSAARYAGAPFWARAAEVAIVIWVGLMVLV